MNEDWVIVALIVALVLAIGGFGALVGWNVYWDNKQKQECVALKIPLYMCHGIETKNKIDIE
jgi:hypothetical protein